MKAIKRIGKGILIIWCLLVLLYISRTTLYIIFTSHDFQDYLYLLYDAGINSYIAILLIVSLLLAVAISIVPKRWWQWLLMILAIFNAVIVAAYGLFLPKPQPCTIQMMTDHYNSHSKEIQALTSFINKTADAWEYSFTYQNDDEWSFIYMETCSKEFQGHNFYEKENQKIADFDRSLCPHFLGTREEQIADSMLFALGIDRQRLKDLMRKAGIVGFSLHEGLPTELIYKHYGLGKEYAYVLMDHSKEYLYRKSEGDIILNDSIRLRCNNFYVPFEFSENEMFYIQPQLLIKYMLDDFPDLEDYQKNMSH